MSMKVTFSDSEGLENPKSREILEKASNFVEKLSKNGVAFMKFTTLGITIPHLVPSYFRYFTTDSGEDSFSLPYLTW